MSLKSLLKVPPAPAKTLVTAELLMAFQRSHGKATMVAASCPGMPYTGNNALRLRMRNLTSPYLGIRFRYMFEAGPSDRTAYWALDEGSAISVPRKHRAYLRLTTTRHPTGFQVFHVHRVEYWIGSEKMAIEPEGKTLVRDTEIKLTFSLPNGNGSNPTRNWVRDILIYSFPEDVTHGLTDIDGHLLEYYSRSG